MIEDKMTLQLKNCSKEAINNTEYYALLDENHPLKKCCSIKHPDDILKLIYGYCRNHNYLYVFYGQTNSKKYYITKLILKSKDLLPKTNTRSYICTNCHKNTLSNIRTIKYYDINRNPYTIGTAIICDICNTLYHFNGENAFLPLNPSLNPIYLNKSRDVLT